jgi:hypothetical protein
MSPAQSIVSSYKERIAFANMLRAELGDVALAAVAISAIRSFRREEWQRRGKILDEANPLPNQAYIIRQLKRPEEVSLLREVYGRQFILISAYASQAWRITRRPRVGRGSSQPGQRACDAGCE